MDDRVIDSRLSKDGDLIRRRLGGMAHNFSGILDTPLRDPALIQSRLSGSGEPASAAWPAAEIDLAHPSRFHFRKCDGDHVVTSPKGETERPTRRPANRLKLKRSFGAGRGIRTLDPNLGKVVLYP